MSGPVAHTFLQTLDAFAPYRHSPQPEVYDQGFVTSSLEMLNYETPTNSSPCLPTKHSENVNPEAKAGLGYRAIQGTASGTP